MNYNVSIVRILIIIVKFYMFFYFHFTHTKLTNSTHKYKLKRILFFPKKFGLRSGGIKILVEIGQNEEIENLRSLK